MPYDLFLHLEQADNQNLFRDQENISRYRFLPQRPSWKNTDGLPVGFVKNKESVGLTCAACHTNQINYQGVGFRIDGAPTLADMSNFLIALQNALNATAQNPDKFNRLANALG